MLLLGIMVGAFALLCYFAARDPENRRDNPNSIGDEDDWRGP